METNLTSVLFARGELVVRNPLGLNTVIDNLDDNLPGHCERGSGQTEKKPETVGEMNGIGLVCPLYREAKRRVDH
jgi:hypothetical protein